MSKEFKQRVLACEKLCGTHTGFNYPGMTELLANIGFDFIWVDTEHATVSPEDLCYHLMACKSGGTPAIIRVSQTDRNQLKRVLELGPDGVIFPMVNTPEAAEEAMKATLYPPKGIRGFGPQRVVRWGLRDMDEYIREVDNELCRFIQIETETAVRNLPEIVKNPFIDGYIFGPCDLSGSIGELNNIFGERSQALIKEAIHILNDNGKCIGVSTGSDDPEVTGYWNDLGINMISSGVDYAYVRDGALRNLKKLHGIQGRA